VKFLSNTDLNRYGNSVRTTYNGKLKCNVYIYMSITCNNVTYKYIYVVPYICKVYIYICIYLIKDELPLDNRVIGTFVNSFFEYSYAPASNYY
jgi:hypothetical protein